MNQDFIGIKTMSYFERIITPSETIHYNTTLSAWYFLPNGIVALLCIGAGLFPVGNISGFVGSILSIELIALGFIILIWAGVRFLTTEMAVTSKRVIYKFGFIMREITEIELNKVASIEVDQGIIGRILGYGDIRVYATGASTMSMRGVANPLAFRAAITAER